MKLSTAVPLLVGLCLVGVMARPLIEYGDARAAGAERRAELTQLLQRLSTRPSGVAYAEQLRAALAGAEPSESQLAQIRQAVVQVEASAVLEKATP